MSEATNHDHAEHQHEEATDLTPAERLAQRRRLLAAFSYFGALFIIPLLMNEKDADVRFHVRQGAVMCAAELFAAVVGWIPVIGWSVAIVVWGMAGFAFVRALQGKRWEIPVVIDYAKKLEF